MQHICYSKSVYTTYMQQLKSLEQNICNKIYHNVSININVCETLSVKSNKQYIIAYTIYL